MSLQDRAMLCSLRLTCWTGERTNKKVSAEVSETKKADAGSATVVVKMVPSRFLKPIRALDMRLRAAHHHYTLPWTDEGARVLPSAVFLDHARDIGVLLDERRREVEQFARVYPAIREEAKHRLGDLYQDDNWPGDVIGFFTDALSHFPVPASEDFRVEMDEADVQRIRDQIGATVTTQLHESMGAVRARVVATIQEFVDRIADYKIEHGVGEQGPRAVGIFRNTVLDGLSRLADVLPKLNLTNDPALDDVAREIRAQLTAHSPEVLREDDGLRMAVVDKAKAIIAKL